MNLLEEFRRITTFVFDVDGVLTDGTVLLLENGLQARQMNIKDGLALQMALKNGYRVVIVSGGSSGPVLTRLQYLGLTEIHLGVNHKKAFIDNFIQEQGLSSEELLFMGDDLPDIELLQFVGMSCCPADAVPEVRSVCRYISPFEGGRGCVRDVIEKVLKVNGRWNYRTEISSR